MDSEKTTPAEPEAVEGKYANYFKVGHNAFEFVVEFSQLYDFAQLSTEFPVEKVHTRIVTSPVYAKELLSVLQESVSEYERVFGTIVRHE